MNETLPSIVQRQIEVLGHEKYGFSELRAIGNDRFISINPRKTNEGTRNEDVSRITCIIIDIDKISKDVDPINVARHIILLEDFKSYVLAFSGRGAHIYLPVDLPTTANVKGFLENIAKTYNDPRYKIDIIADLARVIRLWGSVNSKSGKTCEVVEDHFNGINDLKIPTTTITPTLKPSLPQSLINNGNRNHALTSLAGSMRRKGMSQEAILAAISEENRLKCNPPLSDNEVRSIANSISRYDPAPVKITNSVSKDYFNRLMARKPGYSTGFKSLDYKISGLQNGRIHSFAAFSGFGKTSLACTFAYNLIANSTKVLYFPTELSQDVIFDKVLSQKTQIELNKFQTGSFSEDDKPILQAACENLETMPFSLYEDRALTVKLIREKIDDIQPQVVVLDSINAMFFQEGRTPQEYSIIMRELKDIFEKAHIPLILTCQLNRSALNTEISLSQVEGSNAITEFSDSVFFLVPLKTDDYPRKSNLYVMKSRFGDLGKVSLNMYSKIGRFEEDLI